MKFLKIFVASFLLVGGGTTAVAQDDPKELESNCDAGNLDACVTLGKYFKSDAKYDNVPQDYARAATLFEKACAGKSAEGCYCLGNAYRNGEGVPQDYTLASSHLEQACNLRSFSGCNALTTFYHPNNSLTGDSTQWAVFTEKLCELGGSTSAVHCLRLGLAFDIGMFVPKDPDHATVLFKKGCYYGNKEACDLITR